MRTLADPHKTPSFMWLSLAVLLSNDFRAIEGWLKKKYSQLRGRREHSSKPDKLWQYPGRLNGCKMRIIWCLWCSKLPKGHHTEMLSYQGLVWGYMSSIIKAREVRQPNLLASEWPPPLSPSPLPCRRASEEGRKAYQGPTPVHDLYGASINTLTRHRLQPEGHKNASLYTFNFWRVTSRLTGLDDFKCDLNADVIAPACPVPESLPRDARCRLKIKTSRKPSSMTQKTPRSGREMNDWFSLPLLAFFIYWPLFISLSHFMSFSFSFHLSLYFFLILFLSLVISLSFSFYISLFVAFSFSFYLSMFTIIIPFFISRYISLVLIFSLSVFLSHSLFIFLRYISRFSFI